MANNLKFAIYGHHKCATMFLNGVMRGVCRRLGLRFSTVYDEDMFGKDLGSFLSRERTDFLAYGNADMSYLQCLGDHRAFHIVRDPRDIVVSAYFSHLYSHSTEGWKELVPHRERLQSLSQDEGIAEEIRFRSRSFGHMGTWNYDQNNVLEIRFEDLASRSYETLLSAFEFLQLIDESDYSFRKRLAGLGREATAYLSRKAGRPIRFGSRWSRIPASEFLTIVWRNRYEARASGRSRGQENVHAHYRSGTPGDWRSHFTNHHRDLFKELYPGLVPKLGYAHSDDW